MRPITPLAFIVCAIALGLAGCDQLNPPADTSSSSSAAAASDTTSVADSAAASESVAASKDTSAASSEESSQETSSSSVAMADFPHEEASVLLAGSGSGYSDRTNWAPGICFPLAQTPDYASSQVYNPGGDHYPSYGHASGVQCDPKNYAYPWHDNFCETRGWTNIMCTSGSGHQGQDIRPTTCKANMYWAVAAEDGVVTQIGSYTVAITGNDEPHRIFRYLHMQVASLKVKYGDHVKRGQKLGLVSDNFGVDSNGKQQHTTIHLHFEVRIAQAETLGDGTKLTALTFVPPYSALVDAYSRKLAGDCPSVE